jgi:hypothetical protein
MDQVILFDGICNLCNRAINFVIRHDPGKKFHFATLQSEAGQKLLSQYKKDAKKADTFWLLQQGKLYSRSTAALRVACQLNGPVKWAVIFMLVPAGIRNVLYDWVAANRFRWFGKRESCMQPHKEIAERFIETL